MARKKSLSNMQNALKDIFAPMFEAMLQGEMNSHLGYKNNDRSPKTTSNRRNGYIQKTLNTSRDRDSSFEPKLIAKRSKDVSGIEDKVFRSFRDKSRFRRFVLNLDNLYNIN